MLRLVSSLASLAEQQGGVFLTRQALACGYSDQELARMVRTRQWIRLRRGAFCTAESRSADAGEEGLHRLVTRAVVLALQGSCVVSHLSAAALVRLPLYRAPLDLIHVTRPEIGSSRTEGGVSHHSGELGVGDVVQAHGLQVTSLPRTVIDVALTASFVTALVVAEAALGRGVSTQQLRDQLDRVRDWPDARQASRVVTQAAPGAETVGETLLHLAFDEGGLPTARRQVPIRDGDGVVVARVDALFEEERTIVEFDGREKYLDPQTLWAEKQREDRLRELGYQVVRVTWAELFDPVALAIRIRAAFARAKRAA